MKTFFIIYQKILCTIAVLLLCAMTLPSIFGLTPYVVSSGSMEPTIKTGALSYINTRNVDTIQIDDVVGFKLEDALVMHRIVDYDTEKQLYSTKGDNNDAEDIWKISKENIIGKFVFSIPFLGYVIAYIKSPLGIIVTIGLVVISIVASIIYQDEERQPKKNWLQILADKKTPAQTKK